MGNGQQLQTIDEHRLFQLVRYPQLITAIFRSQLIVTDTYVFDRIGLVIYRLFGRHSRFFEIADFAAAHEVGDEFKLLTIPGVKIWTGGWFSIEFRNSEV